MAAKTNGTTVKRVPRTIALRQTRGPSLSGLAAGRLRLQDPSVGDELEARKPKKDGPGRPKNKLLNAAELGPVLKEECLRRLALAGIKWDDGAERFVTKLVDEYRAEIAAAFASPDRAVCAALLAAMQTAVEKSAGRDSDFAAWVKTNVEPLLESDRYSLMGWAFQVRKEPGSLVTDVVKAIDRTNFLGLIDRPAKDDELAAVLLLMGLPPPVVKGKRVSAGEVIALIAKTVHKARIKHGRPHHLREMRRRREQEEAADPTGELRWMREHTTREKV